MNTYNPDFSLDSGCCCEGEQVIFRPDSALVIVAQAAMHFEAMMIMIKIRGCA